MITKINLQEEQSNAIKSAKFLLSLSPEKFDLSGPTVQGAKCAKLESDGKIYNCTVSPRRFKQFAETAIILYIYSGDGFIKWKKGETKITQGSVYKIAPIGEYEINGNCTFILTKSEG